MIKTIITGANKGIGYNIKKTLLLKNHRIINLSRTCDNEDTYNICNIKCDITKLNTLDIINEIIEKEGKIDNFIHNAGIINDSFFHKMTYDQWINVQNTNFISLYNLLNPIINNMRQNSNGNIILMSSVNAKIGAIGQTNYSSSKSALFGFTKSLALENAHKNILVNCICPGYIESDMTSQINKTILNQVINKIPLKKLGNTEDIANLVDYLLEKNKYMTGSIIDINGGLH